MADVARGVAPGELLVRSGDRIQRLFAVRTGETIWVFCEGQVYEHATPDARRWRTAPAHGTLTAPMPATVVSVNVRPGDAVKSGDILIVLEAMKMELPVRAPGDGRVAAVHCRPGDLVQPDVSLIDFE